MVQSNERMSRVNGVELCTESFGNPVDPAILLIMGATASMMWWPDEFCRRLALQGRHVIRFDNRDTGRSVTYPPGSPGYSLEDLADDAVGVLDAYGLPHAHLAGMSLGGMLAQLVANKYPTRTRSLILIASGPLGPGDPDVPGIDPRVIEYHSRAAELDWSNRAAVVDYMVGGWRLLSGSARPFEEQVIRAIAEREVDRARSPLSASNHALLTGGERWYGRLHEIRAPTLVIHGTDDRVLPHAHGRALARDIPGAELLSLEGVGHELHPIDWDPMIAAIIRHTAAADAPSQGT